MSRGRSIWLEFNEQNCLLLTGITLTPALRLMGFGVVIEKGNPQLMSKSVESEVFCALPSAMNFLLLRSKSPAGFHYRHRGLSVFIPGTQEE